MEIPIYIIVLYMGKNVYFTIVNGVDIGKNVYFNGVNGVDMGKNVYLWRFLILQEYIQEIPYIGVYIGKNVYSLEYIWEKMYISQEHIINIAYDSPLIMWYNGATVKKV